jgi:hypothetical protein
MKSDLQINITGHVLIKDAKTDEVLLDKYNAIHPQNMSRIIARALSNEPNSIIKRIAFGNGGSFTDASSNVIFRKPNDGTEDGWESRLYNETYSEIIDESDIAFGEDPGSADSSSIRIGGGAKPEDDPLGGGVASVEVGKKSNIVVTVFLNEDEPFGQLPNDAPIPSLEADERCFVFDEIGLYSPGKQARNTSGYTNINVGNKTSTDLLGLSFNTNYTLNLEVDGITYNTAIRTPASGSGPSGQLTYGDLCEGINTGAWTTAASSANINDEVYVFITDRSGGLYPSIIAAQSYGFLTFQSKTTGNSSTVNLLCDSNVINELFSSLTGGNCANCNIGTVNGDTAGVANDTINPANERERLLTHIIFSPILKSKSRSLVIQYTLTVSVGRTSDAVIETV